MATKKDNLPLTVENDTEQTSSITYANEVVAIIAGVAAGEVEGVAGMCNVSGSILSKNRNITKGVKVETGTEEASVDLYMIVEYGTPIQKAAQDAQENVRKAIETMTGLHVVRVDVHVQGVSFEKENSSSSNLTAGSENAALAAGSCPADTASRQEPEAAQEPADAPAGEDQSEA
ncbi:MAG: Asp23/Gls24 family envelope stress response protein [Aristaeellaceae bacterium]